MKTFVIILHFGELSTTQACIESLYRVEKTAFYTVVVNNAKKKISEKDFGNKNGLTVINNVTNVGFAKGVNRGIQYAMSEKADAIMLVNNDTTFKQAILPGLLSHVGGKNVGIVAPAIHFYKKSVSLYDMGGKLNSRTGRTSHEEVTGIQDTSLRRVEYVSGCCTAIKSAVFEKIGYFDEHFFLYYEDVDFCLRARKAGYTIAVDPSCIIDHALSKSTGKLSDVSMYHQIRSARIFGKKYFKTGMKKVLQRLFVIYQAMVFVIKSHHVSAFTALFSKI